MPLNRRTLLLAAAALTCSTMLPHATNGSSGGGSGGGGSGSSGSGSSGSGSIGSAPSGGRGASAPVGGRSPGQPAGAGHRGPADQAAQNGATEAVASGNAAPLSQVLAMVRRSVPGEVLDVSLARRESGDWAYRLIVLTQDGDYCDVTVDAKRNKLLQVTYR